MKRALLLVLSICGLSGVPTAHLAAQSTSPSLEDRFKAEYPDAVHRYQEILKHVSGSGRRMIFVRTDAEALAKQDGTPPAPLDRNRAAMKKTSSEEVRFALDFPFMSAVVRPEPGLSDGAKPPAKERRAPDFETGAAVNREAAFRFARAKDGASTRLVDITESSDQRTANPIMIVTFFYFDTLLYPTGNPREKSFPNPDFVIKKFTPSKADGVDLLRIDYEIKYTEAESAKEAKKPGGNRAITSGWFVVRPDDGWVIQESMVSSAARGRDFLHVKVEYGPKQNDILLPKEISLITAFMDNVLQLDTIRHGSSPESEFTLTAFGLPEINQTPKIDNPNRTAFWLIGAGVVVLLAAIGLKVYARRVKVAV